ncbi:MAG: hypothetical protein NLN64_02415 [Candidatus Thalassarchaeaceae archaeon]|nr:hypothetical protein [Candidatus Thalassarchaeaceae archaeon]
MESAWSLIKCICGHNFGIKKGNKIRCFRCSNNNDYKIIKNFSSSIDLRIAVATANAPEEINHIINNKLKGSEAKKYNLNINEVVNMSKYQVMMKNATSNDGVLKLDKLVSILNNNFIEDVLAEDLIAKSEFEGLIIRSAHNEWSWL